MDISSILYEIDSLDKELVRLRKTVSELNKRKKILTDQAIQILNDSDEKVYTFNGKKYAISEKIKTLRKTKKTVKKDLFALFEEEGITGHDAEEMYNKITNTLKGTETISYSLKK